ncbi:hypothetical protein CHELA40_11309 [Chelatococcus asaccharovorans]|nr:hypothetical protein CHELA40_11309 [Chelatococcus asaccharovorans]CAH1685019.1 hypothetical protein CHELA17_64290 [Chelatococcus asaccharovorans]
MGYPRASGLSSCKWALRVLDALTIATGSLLLLRRPGTFGSPDIAGGMRLHRNDTPCWIGALIDVTSGTDGGR